MCLKTAGFLLVFPVLATLGGCGAPTTNRVDEVRSDFQGLYRLTIPGLPSTPNNSLLDLPADYKACESNLSTAARIYPVQNYVAAADTAALVDSLRKLLQQRYSLVDEYSLWIEQAKRVPDYERTEAMEMRINAWKALGWKLDDPAWQRRFAAMAGETEIATLHYYLRRHRNDRGAEIGSTHAQLRSNRNFLQEWHYEVTSGTTSIHPSLTLDRIYLAALQRLSQSGTSGTNFNFNLREIDAFRTMAMRCINLIPNVMMLSKIAISPYWNFDRDAALERSRPAREESASLLASSRKIHEKLSKRAIEETTHAFLIELRNTRKSTEIPNLLIRFYGPGELGKSARNDPGISPAYDAQLSKLQTAEEAERRAVLEKIQAAAAREAEERKKDLKRRIAGNLAPTAEEVESVLASVSAKRTKNLARTQVEATGRSSYLMYSDFLGNRIITGEVTISLSGLKCLAKGNTQNCSWTERVHWTEYHMFGNIKGATRDESSERSGFFQWTSDGLVAVGDVDVSWIEKVQTRTSSNVSNSAFNAARDGNQSLRDALMERELDNRQNYYDSVSRSGGSATGAPYDPTKRY